jgi:hypothetical protein
MQNWQSINAQRRRYMNYSTALMSRILKNIREDYRNAIIEYGPDAAINQFGEANIKQSVQQAFIEIYTLTGVAFAKLTLAQLQKKPIRKKYAVDMLETLWYQYMQDFVVKRCGVKIQSVTRNIFHDIENITKNVVREAGDKGWGPTKVADEIYKEVGRRDKWRALRIARTEVVGASNAGSYHGAGSFSTKINKIWLVNLDDKTRDDHIDMANAPHIPYADKWDVGGEMMLHPGDPDASAENVINCRCAITYEPQEDIIEQLLSGTYENI